MKTLAFDTSTMVTSVCLMEGTEVLGDFSLNQEKTHSESLVPMVDTVLSGLGLSFDSIDLIAVGRGPGSFTGIRISGTTGKTFAQVSGKPLIGVSTLEAIANNVRTEGKILSLLDARGGRYYYSLFKRIDNSLTRLMDDDLIYLEDLVELLKDEKDKINIIGNYNNDVREAFANMTFYPPYIWSIARSVAFLGREMFCSGKSDDYMKFTPNYVRKSQAERDLVKKSR